VLVIQILSYKIATFIPFFSFAIMHYFVRYIFFEIFVRYIICFHFEIKVFLILKINPYDILYGIKIKCVFYFENFYFLT